MPREIFQRKPEVNIRWSINVWVLVPLTVCDQTTTLMKFIRRRLSHIETASHFRYRFFESPRQRFVTQFNSDAENTNFREKNLALPPWYHAFCPSMDSLTGTTHINRALTIHLLGISMRYHALGVCATWGLIKPCLSNIKAHTDSLRNAFFWYFEF